MIQNRKLNFRSSHARLPALPAVRYECIQTSVNIPNLYTHARPNAQITGNSMLSRILIKFTSQNKPVNCENETNIASKRVYRKL